MILGLALLLFLASCVFDPADRMLGLKVELFVACWALALFFIGIRRERLVIPVGLLLYTLAFMLIPMASIAWYYVSDGREPFEGFALLKGYVLITLGVLLFLNRINLLPHLSAMLTLLAAAIAVVFVAVTLEPGLIIPAQICRLALVAAGLVCLLLAQQDRWGPSECGSISMLRRACTGRNSGPCSTRGSLPI